MECIAEVTCDPQQTLVVFAPHLSIVALSGLLSCVLFEHTECFWQVNQQGPIWRHVQWLNKHRRRCLMVPQISHGVHVSSKAL
jgi:hypothetical protein